MIKQESYWTGKRISHPAVIHAAVPSKEWNCIKRLVPRRNGLTTLFGKTVRRTFAASALTLVAMSLSGCLSVNVHHEADHPTPVIVVPEDPHT